MSVVTIGVDPGESVGLVALQNGEMIAAWQLKAVEFRPVYTDLIEYVDDANQCGPVTVGVERFIMSHRTRGRSQQGAALQIVGEVRALTPAGVRVYEQSAADAHAVADVQRLKDLELYLTPRDVNARDATDANMAARHALLVLMRYHTSVYEELLRGRGLLDVRRTDDGR